MASVQYSSPSPLDCPVTRSRILPESKYSLAVGLEKENSRSQTAIPVAQSDNTSAWQRVWMDHDAQAVAIEIAAAIA